MIKAIIFDWHGVLDQTTYRGFSKFLAGVTGKDAGWIRDQVSVREQQYIKGAITPDEFWYELKKRLQLSDAQYEQACKHLLTVQLNQDLWSRLPKLRQRYQMAVLSDCPLDKLAAIRKVTNFENFTVVQFSCENRMGKENADFFRTARERLSLEAAQCLYVDDTSKHIETATRLGFCTHLFTNVEAFDQCLYDLRT